MFKFYTLKFWNFNFISWNLFYLYQPSGAPPFIFFVKCCISLLRVFSLSNKMILHYFYLPSLFYFLGYKNDMVSFYYHACLVHLIKWCHVIFILPFHSKFIFFYFLGYKNDVVSFLLDKINMRDKFMWHLTENMNGMAIDANGIEFQKVYIQILNL